MLRSIYHSVRGAFRTNAGKKSPRPAYLRRLAVESLESRKLLSASSRFSGLSDGDFETPTLTAGAYQVAPTGSPWQFSGIAGLSTNASGFTDGNPSAPQGSQVAFLKNSGSINQTVYLDAGVYSISLLAAQRLNFQSVSQGVEVQVDGADSGVIVPAGTRYAAYQSWNFAVSSGTHTIRFLGMSPSGDDSTAFIDAVTVTPVLNSIVDAGFELPALAANTYQTDPAGLAWQFSGTAGISSNGSDFVANVTVSQNAPEGTQVGYVQQTGSISQTVYLGTGTYQISFLAAQRAAFQSNYQVIEVLIDGSPTGTVTPANTSYAAYQSAPFTVAAGPHTIEFLGMNPLGGDNTAFIDQVTVTAANPVSNSSFETPTLPAGSYQPVPAGTEWQYSGGAGVSSNGSGITSGNPNAPDGAQVAYVNGTGSISESVTLESGSYNLSFQAAQRANVQTLSQQIQVTVDGTQVGLITPVGTTYNLYRTWNFAVTNGSHAIRFIGMNPQGGDNTVLIDEVAISVAKNTITDGGFETPALAAATYQFAPSGLPWQFAGTAGISANNSDFTYGSANAPQGTQAAFIKNNGSLSYPVYLDAGGYTLSLLAAQRAVHQTQNQQIQVLVDGVQVGLITPGAGSYSLYQTSSFSVTAGMHTLEFMGMSPPTSDSTAFLDQVTIASASDSLVDGSFEVPVQNAAAFQVAPSGSPWQFSGSAGVSANGSGFTTSNPNAPDGVQVAFIKNTGSMSQSVFLNGGTYSLSFLAAQRATYQTQDQILQILVDSSPIGWITPGSTSFARYQTVDFTVASGSHTIRFNGISPQTADSTAFVDAAAISVGCTASNGSFETPALAAASFVFGPSGASWQFSGAAGISTNSSAFTIGNPNAPDGVQVAFLKDHGSISQTVYMDAGLYNLSFMAAQRSACQSQYQSLQILVDGVQVGAATPSGTNYGRYQTSNFTVTAGIHTIMFAGLNPMGGDNTAFVDEVHF